MSYPGEVLGGPLRSHARDIRMKEGKQQMPMGKKAARFAISTNLAAERSREQFVTRSAERSRSIPRCDLEMRLGSLKLTPREKIEGAFRYPRNETLLGS